MAWVWLTSVEVARVAITGPPTFTIEMASGVMISTSVRVPSAATTAGVAVTDSELFTHSGVTEATLPFTPWAMR